VHYKAILGKDRVLVGNPEVLKQILVTNVYNYTKPPATALEYAVGGTIHEYFSLIWQILPRNNIFYEQRLFLDYELTNIIFILRGPIIFRRRSS
jgi:hypothetical protein